MSKPDLSDEEIQALIAEFRASPKYRDINLPGGDVKGFNFPGILPL